MLKLRLSIALLLVVISSHAQVRIVIEKVPNDTDVKDTLYFASNINRWNPADSMYRFKRDNITGIYSLEIEKIESTVEYKITRGAWDKVETDYFGKVVGNRTLSANYSDVSIDVQGWNDHLFKEENTSSPNVIVLTDSLYMPQFNRYRRICLYIPQSYYSSDKRYPVVYMHDGQNLFNSSSSFYGEWQVDESMDSICKVDSKYEAIIVAIDNGGQYRIEELTPFNNKQYGGGMGRDYMEFIVKSLKPFIDINFRTLSDRDNTYLIGSSLGGLISLYGLLSYPEVFSGAAIMSPSLWFSNRIYYLPSFRDKIPVKMYLLAGDTESESMLPNLQKLEQAFVNYGYPKTSYTLKVVKGGKHNEELWRNGFANAFIWLLNK